MHTPGAENNPCDLEVEDGSIERRGWREAGITTAMTMKFAEGHRLGVHVFWGQTKTTTYTPGPGANKSICLYVWGDHCFMVDDPQAKSAIAQSKVAFSRSDRRSTGPAYLYKQLLCVFFDRLTKRIH